MGNEHQANYYVRRKTQNASNDSESSNKLNSNLKLSLRTQIYPRAAMLRIEPTRIYLTPFDISDLDNRLAHRTIHRPFRTGIWLSPGPCRRTTITSDSLESNCTSVESGTETLVDGKDEHGDDCIHGGSVASTLQRADSMQPESCEIDSQYKGRTRRLQDHAAPYTSPVMSSPRRQIDGFFGLGSDSAILPGYDSAEFDEANDISMERFETTNKPPVGPELSRKNRGRSVPDSIHCEAFPASRQQNPQQSISFVGHLSRNSPSREDVLVHQTDAELEGSTALVGRYKRNEECQANSNTKISSSGEDSVELMIPSFDPKAPVFIPRTRFAINIAPVHRADLPSWTGSQWRPNERINVISHGPCRSPLETRFEASIGIEELQPHESTFEISEDNRMTHTVIAQDMTTRPRESNDTTATEIRSTGQATALLSPPLPTQRQRSSSTSILRPSLNQLSLGTNPSNASHPQHVEVLMRSNTTILTHGSTHDFSQLPRDEAIVFHNQDLSRSFTTTLLQAEPTSSSKNSPSTVSNLEESAESDIDFNKLECEPGIITTIAGNNQRHRIGRNSATSEDAATAFLQMRESPLDDLTAQLSRLCSNRSRSVGRSWSRRTSNHARVSLLTGNPFGHDARLCSSSLEPSDADLPLDRSIALEDDLTTDLPLYDSIPRSSQTTSPIVPTQKREPTLTLTSASTSASTARNATSSLSYPPDRAPTCASSDLPRYPQPSSPTLIRPIHPEIGCTTPHIKIYDDNKPANTQPATPLDLPPRSATRRANIRAEQSSVTPAIPTQDQSTMTLSPPTMSERRIYRNSMPLTTAATMDSQVVETASSSQVTTLASPFTSLPVHEIRRRMRAATATAQEADDMQAHARALQRDQQIWMSRRDESGTLDITPPREGRFERYLL